MAAFQILHALGPLDDQLAVVDGFPLHRLIEHRAERIVAEHADGDRRAGIGKGRGRPLDKLREVKQEGRLDLILLGGLSPGRDHSGQAQSQQRQRARAPQCRSVTQRRKRVRAPGPTGDWTCH